MVRETHLRPGDFILPLFVRPGKGVKQVISSMPGHAQLSIDLLIKGVEEVQSLVIPGVILFGIPENKDEMGTEAYAEDGIIQRAVKAIKEKVEGIMVITDVCLCEYTSHGHCGVVKGGKILNDETLDLLARQALSHVRAGADMVAPSDMMDGRVGAIIPHFEKMADDNAWLLRNYTDAYALTGNGYFREVAVGIISFLRTVLSDPAGGFYAGQDADVTPDDEGGYFTWTDEELKGCLDPREYEIMSRYLFHERGSMHHDPSKKVLFPAMTLEAVAQMMGTNSSAAGELITQAKMKMLAERNKREAPFVDTAIYTSLNGMLAASCLKAYRVFGDPFLESFSLKTLARIREMHFINSELFHADGVRALLDDYIYLCEAYIAAYEATADTAHLGMAETLMEQCIRKLWDTDEGGFFDTESAVIGLRLKGIEDIPHPSPNATAITLLLKLCHLTGQRFYFEHAEQALRVFGPPPTAPTRSNARFNPRTWRRELLIAAARATHR